MNEDRRVSDSPIRIWGPTAAMIATIAVAWGAMDSRLVTIGETQKVLVTDVRQLRDARITGDSRLDWIQDKVGKAEVSAQLISEMSRELGTIQAAVEALQGNQKQIWPRLRAHDANEALIQRALEKLGAPVQLETPDKF